MLPSYPEETKGDDNTELLGQRKHAPLSPEVRAAQKAKKAAAVKLCRHRKNASMSPEERAAQKAKKAA
eukprot:CAMPEP_0201688094 /NCGR_PEP_ID=MMETSP0578-20130828/1859_1 /ASSEMBLY_ACC=CAM_ASM_000663 /TAXON_ID=267565 /ORGANISM="Skeletonema grethea, Strain CCMP 1804" /LENGTH=67 /DNA_ID=CAMNT_0048172293 /DNA_START=197 /DNA_END=396 /DNA_ORIENTATION=+